MNKVKRSFTGCQGDFLFAMWVIGNKQFFKVGPILNFGMELETHWFYYNENLYYLLCSYTNTISGKNYIKIWAKMFSANQISGFFDQPYL